MDFMHLFSIILFDAAKMHETVAIYKKYDQQI